MISANELRQITEASQTQIDAILAKIEPELVKAAEAGKRSYACYKETPWESVILHTHPPAVTIVQQRLIDELKKHGCNAKMEFHGDPYVPRSANDHDPEVQNYVLVIRW